MQSKLCGFHLTGSEEGLSRADVVMLEADRTAAFSVLGPSDPLQLQPHWNRHEAIEIGFGEFVGR